MAINAKRNTKSNFNRKRYHFRDLMVPGNMAKAMHNRGTNIMMVKNTMYEMNTSTMKIVMGMPKTMNKNLDLDAFTNCRSFSLAMCFQREFTKLKSIHGFKLVPCFKYSWPSTRMGSYLVS